MPDYDVCNQAIRCVAPTNRVIPTARGSPSVFVDVQPMKLSELLANGDDSLHPAFMVNGSQVSQLSIGKYKGMLHKQELLSLPSSYFDATANHDHCITYARNCGSGFHVMTAAEWGFLCLRAKKRGTIPWGNTLDGRDSREPTEQAIKSYSFMPMLGVLTGTGPEKWTDTWNHQGVHDLTGNGLEIVTGIQLTDGKLQVIPWNNAALPETDLSEYSSDWRYVNAQATGWDDLWTETDADDTTVKIQYDISSGVKSHLWCAGRLSILGSSNSSFGNVKVDSSISAFCRMYLESLALCPEADEDTSVYSDDMFWLNSNCQITDSSWEQRRTSTVFYRSVAPEAEGANVYTPFYTMATGTHFDNEPYVYGRFLGNTTARPCYYEL